MTRGVRQTRTKTRPGARAVRIVETLRSGVTDPDDIARKLNEPVRYVKLILDMPNRAFPTK